MPDKKTEKVDDAKFLEELTLLITKYDLHHHLSTPDYIIAGYILRLLEAYKVALVQRMNWLKDDGDEEEDDATVFIQD